MAPRPSKTSFWSFSSANLKNHNVHSVSVAQRGPAWDSRLVGWEWEAEGPRGSTARVGALGGGAVRLQCARLATPGGERPPRCLTALSSTFHGILIDCSHQLDKNCQVH